VSQNVTKFRWTPRRERAALALAKAKTETKAAEEIGVARETVWRWNQHPEFQRRVQDNTERVLEEARLVLMRNAQKAAETVVDMMYWGLPGHRTRLQAACEVLDRVGIREPERHEHHGSGAIAIHWETVDYRQVLQDKFDQIVAANDAAAIDGEVME
jgi:hypothetical protein